MHGFHAFRLPFQLPRTANLLDVYELQDVKPEQVPLLMLVPFAFAIGAVNLIWLYATGATLPAILAAAFGPAIIISLWLPATANLRHRARSVWGKDAKLMTIISAIITTCLLMAAITAHGVTPMALIIMVFAAAWNPALHGGLLLAEARAFRRANHIGEYAIRIDSKEDCPLA